MSDGPPPIGRTAAIVVVYRPTEPPTRLLNDLRDAVQHVVVVDNDEAGDPRLPELVRSSGATLLRQHNRAAVAGAYNRAVAWLREGAAGPIDQVVLLDQDSDAGILHNFLADADVRRQLADPATAAVAPAYRDRATGLRGRYIQLDRWRVHHLPRELPGLHRVAFVINSMSVWRMPALAALGPFDEDLALDHVDTEHCLRARRHGLSVWVHGDHVFGHTIGQRRRYRLLGRDLQAGGHTPQRRLGIARNTVRLMRRWAWREPAFAGLCLARVAYEAVGIVMAEDRRSAKLWALLQGVCIGLLGPRRA